MLHNQYLFSCVAALATFAAAVPQPLPDTNWEMVTNEFGFTVPQFKAGEEPGSANYLRRFGDKYTADHPAAIKARQDTPLYTVGLAGENQIAYGCDTNIAEQVFGKVRELCGGEICDRSFEADAEIETLSAGKREGGSLKVAAQGPIAPYTRDAVFSALDSLVIPEAVKFENEQSFGPQISPYLIPASAACDMPKASSFYSVVARENDENGPLVSIISVYISKDTENTDFCGIFTGAGTAIVGAMNAAAGAVLGVIGPVACSFAS